MVLLSVCVLIAQMCVANSASFAQAMSNLEKVHDSILLEHAFKKGDDKTLSELDALLNGDTGDMGDPLDIDLGSIDAELGKTDEITDAEMADVGDETGSITPEVPSELSPDVTKEEGGALTAKVKTITASLDQQISEASDALKEKESAIALKVKAAIKMADNITAKARQYVQKASELIDKVNAKITQTMQAVSDKVNGMIAAVEKHVSTAIDAASSAVNAGTGMATDVLQGATSVVKGAREAVDFFKGLR